MFSTRDRRIALATKQVETKRALASQISQLDHATLFRLGKRPALKRTFGFASILGFSAMISIVWNGAAITIQYGLHNGGPAGLIYGFIMIWLGCLLSYVTMGELASMAPTSGGQYHWVSMLAPASYHKFLSYITGWVVIAGWHAAAASAANLTAGLIFGIVSLNNENFHAEAYQMVLLQWAIIASCIFVNIWGGSVLPKFEAVTLIIYILAFIGILVPLLTLSSHQPASWVFGYFNNGGNFPTMGLSFMVGASLNMYVISGADGAIHMAEEIENAPVIVPRAIVASYVLNGAQGLAMLVAICFCIEDLEAVLNSPAKYPALEIFRTAVQSFPGASVMGAFLPLLMWASCASALAAASRQLWAFSRDRGLPGWRTLETINKTTSVPLYAVLLSCVILMLLTVLVFASDRIFKDIVSLATAGLYSSYLLCTLLLLYRRLKGDIKPYYMMELDNANLVNTAGAELFWGPWHIPGFLGTALNVFVVIFLLITWSFTFWPEDLPITPYTMNWNCVEWGGVIIIASIWYLFKGKDEFSGPIIEGREDEPKEESSS